MKEPIRVLHYGMSSNVGGVESFIMNVYRKINKKKIQFDFLTFENSIAYAEEIEELGGKIHQLTSRRENAIENHKQLYTFFKEHSEYEFIHFHFNTASYIKPLIIASKNPRRKLIIHSHSKWTGKNIRIKLFHHLNKFKLTRKSERIFAVSEAAGEFMFGKKGNFKVLKNGIDSELYRYNPIIRQDMRSRLNLNEKFVVGHVGGLTYAKNHEFLLDIFNDIYKVNKNAVLLLIGSGGLEEKIKEKIKKLRLEDSVQMLGTRNDIPNLLQAMDVFVFPSHFEGLPISLVEAQAAGLPCVVSDVITEQVCIIDNFKFQSISEDSKVWAASIIKYCNGPMRQDTYYKIINSGYDISGLVSYLEEVYLS